MFIQPSMSHSLRPALQRERVLWGADLLRELVLRGALEAEGQQRSGCRTGPKGFMRSGSPEAAEKRASLGSGVGPQLTWSPGK